MKIFCNMIFVQQKYKTKNLLGWSEKLNSNIVNSSYFNITSKMAFVIRGFWSKVDFFEFKN